MENKEMQKRIEVLETKFNAVLLYCKDIENFLNQEIEHRKRATELPEFITSPEKFWAKHDRK